MPRELDLFPPSFLQYVGPRISYPKHYFFISFEDALWSIIESLRPSLHAPVLYPAFFCMDVVDSLKARGFNCIPYAVSDDLTPLNLADAVREFTPSIVFLYHPLGRRITFSAESDFITSLPADAIFIEDCVDCLLMPEDIVHKHSRHIIIDSLRKTSALQGSRAFLPPNAPPLRYGSHFSYRLRVTAYHLAVRFLQSIGRMYPSRVLRTLKWTLFGIHSDLIGKSSSGNRGCIIDKMLAPYIDVSGVRDKKRGISKAMRANFSSNIGSQQLLISDESGLMRFFALLLPKGQGARIAQSIEADDIFIDTHFDDSPHCADKDYLLIPLSIEMTSDDINRLTSALKKYL